MEYCRSESRDGYTNENEEEGAGGGKYKESRQCKCHPKAKCIRGRLFIRIISHDGLKYRRRHLKHEGDQPNLQIGQIEINFQYRVNCRYNGLQSIVQKMAKTNSK